MSTRAGGRFSAATAASGWGARLREESPRDPRRRHRAKDGGDESEPLGEEARGEDHPPDHSAHHSTDATGGEAPCQRESGDLPERGQDCSQRRPDDDPAHQGEEGHGLSPSGLPVMHRPCSAQVALDARRHLASGVHQRRAAFVAPLRAPDAPSRPGGRNPCGRGTPDAPEPRLSPERASPSAPAAWARVHAAGPAGAPRWTCPALPPATPDGLAGPEP